MNLTWKLNLLNVKHHGRIGLLFILLIIIEQDLLTANHNILTENTDTVTQKPLTDAASASLLRFFLGH